VNELAETQRLMISDCLG